MNHTCAKFSAKANNTIISTQEQQCVTAGTAAVSERGSEEESIGQSRNILPSAVHALPPLSVYAQPITQDSSEYIEVTGGQKAETEAVAEAAEESAGESGEAADLYSDKNSRNSIAVQILPDNCTYTHSAQEAVPGHPVSAAHAVHSSALGAVLEGSEAIPVAVQEAPVESQLADGRNIADLSIEERLHLYEENLREQAQQIAYRLYQQQQRERRRELTIFRGEQFAQRARRRAIWSAAILISLVVAAITIIILTKAT